MRRWKASELSSQNTLILSITFDGIMEYGIVHVINGCSELVARDGEYEAICRPCLAFGGIGGTEFFMLGSGGSDRNDKIGRRFGGRNVESGAVARLIDGRILEEAEMALLVPPWAGNSHEVGGEFPEHDFLDTCEGGVQHLGLDTVGGDSIQHVDSI